MTFNRLYLFEGLLETYHLFFSLVDEQVQLLDVHPLLSSLRVHLFVDSLLLGNLVSKAVANNHACRMLQALLLQLPKNISQL